MENTSSYKKVIISGPPKANLPFCSAIGCGPFVFLSGLVGRNENGEIAAGDIAAQTTQAMRNLAFHLEKAGTSLDNALKATIFITDMASYPQMNEAYSSFFRAELPARSCVEVAQLPDPEALVEIEMIAVRPPEQTAVDR